MIKAAAQIAVAFAPLLLACAFPFLRVLQGRRILPQFAKCWALLIFWMVVFTLVIPLVGVKVGSHLDIRQLPDRADEVGDLYASPSVSELSNVEM